MGIAFAVNCFLRPKQNTQAGIWSQDHAQCVIQWAYRTSRHWHKLEGHYTVLCVICIPGHASQLICCECITSLQGQLVNAPRDAQSMRLSEEIIKSPFNITHNSLGWLSPGSASCKMLFGLILSSLMTHAVISFVACLIEWYIEQEMMCLTSRWNSCFQISRAASGITESQIW